MRQLFLLVLGIYALVGSASWAESIDDHIESAREQDLGFSPTWLALLHYKKEIFGGSLVSQADDDAFFLSDEGKNRPQLELLASIREFTRPARVGHPQCLFPARWHWIKQQLEISDDLYDVSCPKLDDWLRRADSDQLTLVFPSMYLNNPGSMFGHTFLRFDHSEKAPLLSYALNYAAKADPSDNILTYAYRGISGGYRGIFATRPYYETVQLYTDIENRDIWEYRLDYSPDEIKQLLRHVWEVTGIKFDYYFFTENCSYRLLALLDAVKPTARLSSRDMFPLQVIPVDTVRVTDDAGLILRREYRPSLASKIVQGHSELSEREAGYALELAVNEVSVADLESVIDDDNRRARVIDLAYLIAQFYGKSDESYIHDLLSHRSRLPSIDTTNYMGESPESGHESMMSSVGYGEVRGEQYINLRIRPAFHSLIDNPLGYVGGAEIGVLDAEFRVIKEVEDIQLEALHFFHVTSLAPLTSWNKPLSWTLDIAVERRHSQANAETLTFLTKGGVGLTTKLFQTLGYVLFMIEGDFSKRLDKGHDLLSGFALGAVSHLGWGQAELKFEDLYSTGKNQDIRTAEALVSFNLSKDQAVYLEYSDRKIGSYDAYSWNAGFRWFY